MSQPCVRDRLRGRGSPGSYHVESWRQKGQPAGQRGTRRAGRTVRLKPGAGSSQAWGWQEGNGVGRASGGQRCEPRLSLSPHSSSLSLSFPPSSLPIFSPFCSLSPNSWEQREANRTVQSFRPVPSICGLVQLPSRLSLVYCGSWVHGCLPAAPWWPEPAAAAGMGAVE